jgi:cell division protein FtsQ
MTAPTLDRPAAPIDPRFRARRIAVARDAGRRRLYRLVALGVVTVLVVATLAALRSPLLDVDRVVVTGADHTTPAAVVEASGIRPGDAVVDVDAGVVARRLAALPWVGSATVERRWPGTVAVEVTERVPVAVVEDGPHRFLLVDADRRVLATQAAAPAGLVRLEGVPGDAEPGERLEPAASAPLAVAAALPPTLARATGAVALDDDEVQLRLVPFGIVRLGTTDDLTDKFLATATVLARVDPTGFGILDVRVPSAPVLTRVPGGG